MKYLSVCSGIEAATVAWHHMGWQPVAFSDIEPFPSAVLAHHYPHVPNLGDMTKFEEWNLGTVDLLVGGTPCQSFSVAGLRKGLADPRGNLMLTFLAIAQRHRPQWIVWENVPGVLSSNGGRDFGTFLGALGELGYGFAYRVLDAQWFGVAQRRRRVFVVGCLGDWQRPAQVLFERESVRRDTSPSREKGQETAQCLTTGVRKRYDAESETLPVAFHHNAQASQLPTAARDTTISDALTVSQQAAVAQPVAQPITQFGDIAGSLTARHDSSPCADRGQNVVAQPVAMRESGQGYWMQDTVSGTLRAEGENRPSRPSNVIAQSSMQVRRLTPVECERLQGFPEGYTNIPWRKKPESPDGPRYKALGNSMAVPVMRWIGERIRDNSLA